MRARHRRRVENPWAALFGDASAKNVVADAVAVGVAGVFTEAQTAVSSEDLTQASHGKGRAVYTPLVVDPATQPSLMTVHGQLDTALDHTNWVVPECADALNRAIDWLLEGRESRRVTAGRGMLAESLVQATTGRTLVHLVNLCPEPQRACTVAFDATYKPEAVTVLHPPADLAPCWRVERTSEQTHVVFELLDVYAVVVVQGQ